MTRVSLWSTLFSSAKVLKSAPAGSGDAAHQRQGVEEFTISRQQRAHLAGLLGGGLYHAPDPLAIPQQRRAAGRPQRRPEAHAVQHVLVACRREQLVYARCIVVPGGLLL